MVANIIAGDMFAGIEITASTAERESVTVDIDFTGNTIAATEFACPVGSESIFRN